MSRLRIQAILPAASEKHEDDVVNVWHFQTVSPANADDNYGPLHSALGRFYDGWSAWMPGHRKHQVDFKFFDLADPMPRQPVYEDTYLLTHIDNAAAFLPNECAVVLSLRAAPASGQPIARRRGRVYCGPFQVSANDTVGRPKLALQQDILDAAVALGEETNGAFPSPGGWQIYSPTDDIMRQVVFAYVDDAWDIQRRRGIDPSSRVFSDIATGP